ncbi:MAG TPA: peptidoglycan-associated lipoprotein Pal [Candidatus Methylomirabilis sp.]
MMRRCIHLRVAVIFLGVFLMLAGCGKRTAQTGGPGAGAGAPGEGKMTEEQIAKQAPIREVPVTPTPGVREGGPAAGTEGPLKDVFFDFDKSLLTEDAKRTLDDNIRWLRTNPAARFTIEGHGDERGTNEYNLALGEHRAKAVRGYLTAAGIDDKRISTISYGEERPFVLGHDEAAWKWNRRGHFIVVTR